MSKASKTLFFLSDLLGALEAAGMSKRDFETLANDPKIAKRVVELIRSSYKPQWNEENFQPILRVVYLLFVPEISNHISHEEFKERFSNDLFALFKMNTQEQGQWLMYYKYCDVSGGMEYLRKLRLSSSSVDLQVADVLRTLQRAGGSMAIDFFLTDTGSARQLSVSTALLSLSSRAMSGIRRARIETLGELVQQTENDLLAISNLGQEAVNEIIEKLASLGLKLRDS
jgi:Bacterial RNA polymerase, alpha chain C terminal domain